MLTDRKLINTFDEFNNEKIQYVILRGYTPIEEIETSKDIDLYISKNDYQKVKKLLEKNGWYTPKINDTRFPHKQYICMENRRMYKLDIVFGLYYNEKLFHYIEEKKVLENTRMIENVAVPSPISALKTYLLHVIFDKQIIKEKNYNYIKQIYDEYCKNEEKADNTITIFEKIANEIINQSMEDSNKNIDRYQKLIKNQNALDYNVLRHIYFKYASSIKYKIRKISKIFAKKNITIIGVDGTGKSTVIKNLANTLEDKVAIQYMGFRSYETKRMKKYDKEDETKANLIKKIKMITALHYEMLYRYFKYRFTTKITIFDRYPYEAYINNTRGTRLLYKLLFYTTFPKPKAKYYLYCDVETSLERKADIPDASKFAKMKKRFDDIYLKDDKVCSIDTKHNNCEEVENIIIEDLNKRMIKYFI